MTSHVICGITNLLAHKTTLWQTNSVTCVIRDLLAHKITLYDNKSCHTCHQWQSWFCEILYQKISAPQPSTQQDFNCGCIPGLMDFIHISDCGSLARGNFLYFHRKGSNPVGKAFSWYAVGLGLSPFGGLLCRFLLQLLIDSWCINNYQ